MKRINSEKFNRVVEYWREHSDKGFREIRARFHVGFSVAYRAKREAFRYGDRLFEKKERLREFVKANPSATIREAAKVVGMSTTWVYSHTPKGSFSRWRLKNERFEQ